MSIGILARAPQVLHLALRFREIDMALALIGSPGDPPRPLSALECVPCHARSTDTKRAITN